MRHFVQELSSGTMYNSVAYCEVNMEMMFARSGLGIAMDVVVFDFLDNYSNKCTPYASWPLLSKHPRSH